MVEANEANEDDLGRLEAALERIAALAHKPQIAAGPTIDTAALSTRLDRLIGQIQDALAEPGPAAQDPIGQSPVADEIATTEV